MEPPSTNLGRKAEPTVGILDAQAIKTTLVAGEQRGFDAGKKVNGRKHPVIVDTLGLVLIHLSAIRLKLQKSYSFQERKFFRRNKKRDSENNGLPCINPDKLNLPLLLPENFF